MNFQHSNPRLAAPAILVLRLSIAAALLWGFDWTGDHLDIIRGQSIPYSIAWIQGGPIHKGDYVVFQAQHPLIANGERTWLTKQVVCVEGEDLRFDGVGFACAGTPLGAAIHRTFDGRVIAVAVFNGVIPAHEVFVMGSHPRSFDSRYLGLLDVSTLTRVRPLL